MQKFLVKRNIRKKIIIGLYAFLIIGILSVGASYAFFQNETEITFINAKIRFPTASEVTYTTANNISVKNVEQALNDLYGKLGK